MNFKREKRGFVSTRSWKTKEGAEKARKRMPLGNNFKSFKSRKDGKYRIKPD